MRKSVAAAAMAASLTVGGAAGAALFVPTISGAQTDDDPSAEDSTESDETENHDSRRHDSGDFLADALAPLVEDGTIDQNQADAVIAAIQETRPEGFGHHGHRGPGLFGDALTDILGISAEDLRAAIADGQTVAEIAEGLGIPVDDIVAALVAQAEEHLDVAVENGRITEEEATDKLADATEHINEFLNNEIELGNHRRHHDGPFGSGDDTADDDAGDETTGS